MVIQKGQFNSIRRVVFATLTGLTSIYGHPLLSTQDEDEPDIDFGSPEFYEKMVVIMALVLLGGAFAGK
jgi:hypothetical protein